VDQPIVGEARVAAPRHLDEIARRLATLPRPLCVVSSGETTVTVTGSGRGGRNQEFALASIELVSAMPGDAVLASFGTDGIDGPTDAAGALVDSATAVRAAEAGLNPEAFLTDNNTYEFFQKTGDLIRTGPTDTNVGDVQVLLLA
jgi:hydroxypyruvate reductase